MCSSELEATEAFEAFSLFFAQGGGSNAWGCGFVRVCETPPLAPENCVPRAGPGPGGQAQTGNATGLANGVMRPGTPAGRQQEGGKQMRGRPAAAGAASSPAPREAAPDSRERLGPAGEVTQPGAAATPLPSCSSPGAPRAAARPGLNLFLPESVAESPDTPRALGCCLKSGRLLLALPLRLSPASQGRGEGLGRHGNPAASRGSHRGRAMPGSIATDRQSHCGAAPA